ncbi:Glutathione synthetase, chloroplastic [Vitis vinifera]|uniref:Glutathione synthetase, chloroplastic n=1 Tax=Vitis vinifera TaxID=29760 RepID=A0A438KCH8_VITVI|nr:Glutathione synthetase, chloroplastic [Vitis vinifera]
MHLSTVSILCYLFQKDPGNSAVTQFAEALAQAWKEYNNPEIDAEGKLLPDGTLTVGGQPVAVIYFRAGYAPTDYPSESVRMESKANNGAVICCQVSFNFLSFGRFLENKDDIAKLRKCFAGLWSLDDSNIIKEAIERPEVFVMKPQREGGGLIIDKLIVVVVVVVSITIVVSLTMSDCPSPGNNIYGDDVRETLLRLQKEGTEEDAAYILMQRIFPNVSPTFLMREGICYKDHAISELGIYGAYLRNKEKVIINDQCGHLMRTKVSSSNEGGVAAGFAVLDSIYLT